VPRDGDEVQRARAGQRCALDDLQHPATIPAWMRRNARGEIPEGDQKAADDGQNGQSPQDETRFHM
jgi:hypothetical protein